MKNNSKLRNGCQDRVVFEKMALPSKLYVENNGIKFEIEEIYLWKTSYGTK